MVDPLPVRTFQQSALVSKLIDQSDLDQAAAAVRTERGTVIDLEPQRTLADKLVEMGRLTQYQADQLLKGVTRFQLGKYRITGSIGQGGMGQVFLAEHAIMGREVAVKVLPKHKSTPESIASFNNEIRVLAALDHPHLVRAYDAGFDGNVYFLVCEYVVGSDLRRLVRRRGPLNMADAATVISQAAFGLEHAHARGLIHRDIKPGNLLVTPDGHCKVSDLGLAGSVAGDVDDPKAGKVVGTADYISPEQVLTPREVTTACDIYSLGCTLYYAVTGKVPYPGGTSREKARRHCQDSPINPRVLNPTLSPAFIEIIAAMMQKNPAYRVPNAQAVIERLAPWAKGAIKPLTDADCLANAPRGSSPPPILADGNLADTADALDDDEGEGPLPQVARTSSFDGTDAIAAAGQDTLPNSEPAPAHAQLPGWALYAIPAGIVGGVLIAGLIMWAVLR